MSGIRLAGIASGLDWSSLVDQLISISRIPQDRLRTQKTNLGTQSSAVGQVKTSLASLRASINALGDGAVSAAKLASIQSTTSTWTASAASDAVPGSHTFNVTTLATQAKLNGSVNVGAGLHGDSMVETLVSNLSLSQAISAGEFSVNGVKIDVATNESLQDVLDRIGTDTGGAVTATYNSATDRVELSSAAPIVLGSANDTSNFLQALKLNNNGTGFVTSSGDLGAVRLGNSVATSGLSAAITAVDGGGNGTFTINGVAINYNVNTDSLQTVLSRIGSSAAGVTASYDVSADRFVLTNKVTGDLGINVSEAAGGLLGALGLTGGASLAAGTNAVFTVNGGSNIISTSNTLTEAQHGITGLTVTATTATAEVVEIKSDTSSLKSKVDDFIAKYNSSITLIENLTRVQVGGTDVTASVLTGNRSMIELLFSLRNVVFGATSSATGVIKRLADMGIDFASQDTKLAIRDSALLDQALADSVDDVDDFFGNVTDGLVKRLDDFLGGQVDDLTGALDAITNNFSARQTELDEQIASLERQLTSERRRLEAGFIEMERAQALIQQQGQSLLGAINQLSTGSRNRR